MCKINFGIVLRQIIVSYCFISSLSLCEVLNHKRFYKIANVQNGLFLTVALAPDDTGTLRTFFGQVTTSEFKSQRNQIWTAFALNRTGTNETNYWLFPEMFPINIVSTYLGPYVIQPMANLITLMNCEGSNRGRGVLIRSETMKLCLSIPRDTQKEFVLYESCNETSEHQQWIFEVDQEPSPEGEMSSAAWTDDEHVIPAESDSSPQPSSASASVSTGESGNESETWTDEPFKKTILVLDRNAQINES